MPFTIKTHESENHIFYESLGLKQERANELLEMTKNLSSSELKLQYTDILKTLAEEAKNLNELIYVTFVLGSNAGVSHFMRNVEVLAVPANDNIKEALDKFFGKETEEDLLLKMTKTGEA